MKCFVTYFLQNLHKNTKYQLFFFSSERNLLINGCKTEAGRRLFCHRHHESSYMEMRVSALNNCEFESDFEAPYFS